MKRPPPFSWIDSACLYAAECGWMVVPFHACDARGRCTCGEADCSRPGDHPRFDDWRDEAAADERTIESWQPLFPTSHLGVVCGPASNLVILACSALHGHGAHPRTLTDDGRCVPDGTPHATDGSERALYCFRHPGRALPPRTTLGPGLHLYGDGAAVRIPHHHLAGAPTSLRWRQTPLMDRPPPLPAWVAEAAGLGHAPSPALPVGQSEPLPFVAADALLDDPAHDAGWLLRPWVQRAGLTLVVGPPLLAGKTTWCLHMAAALLGGDPFLGHEAVRTPAVYLSEEEPAVLRQRLAGVGAHVSVLHQMSVLHRSPALRAMPWPELMEASVDHAVRRGAEVLFVDSLPAFAGSDPADGASEAVHRPLLRARERGVAVVGTWPAAEAPVATMLAAPGDLTRAAQTVLVLRGAGDHGSRQRIVEAVSRLEAPSRLLVELDAEGLRRAGPRREPPGPGQTMRLLAPGTAAA